MAGQADGAAQKQHGGRPHGPGLLGPHQPVFEDLLGQEIGRNGAALQSLDHQPVGHAEAELVLHENRGGNHLRPGEPHEAVQPVHLEAQALRQIPPQAGQLHGIAQGQGPFDLGRPVDAREIRDRPLHLAQQVAEHLAHGLEDGFGVLGGLGVALEVLGLGEGEFQFLDQGLGEMASADRDAPLPHAEAVGDHQIAGIGAHREHHGGRGRGIGIELFRRGQVAQLVEVHEVVQGQGRQLHDIDRDAHAIERLQGPQHLVALDGEQADLGLQRKPLFLHAAAHALVVPDHIVQIEGDLLPGLVPDDIGDFLGLDRGQADEARQAALPGDRNGHPRPPHAVARQELGEGLVDQFGRVGARLVEELGVLDEIEGLGHKLPGLVAGPATQGLQ